MKLRNFFGSILLATCAVSHAETIDFNNTTEQFFINTVQESGYTVSLAYADGMGTLTGGDSLWNTTGSKHLMTWSNVGDVSGFNLTKVDGSAFSINSFVYGNGYAWGDRAPTKITVTGITDSSTISTNIDISSLGVYTYNFDNQWSNVSSVSFAAYGFYNRTIFDDINVGAAVANNVPEPATTALLGLGLLGFAASRRKSASRKNA